MGRDVSTGDRNYVNKEQELGVEFETKEREGLRGQLRGQETLENKLTIDEEAKLMFGEAQARVWGGAKLTLESNRLMILALIAFGFI